MCIALLLNKWHFSHGTTRANDHGRETRANNSEAGKQWPWANPAYGHSGHVLYIWL